MFSSKRFLQPLIAIVATLAIILVPLAQIPLVRAQLEDDRIVPVAFPVNAPYGLQVNSLTGNLYYSRHELTVRGGGTPLQLTLNYNSFSSTARLGYGVGWQMNHNLYYEENVAGDIRIYQDTGGWIDFLRQGGAFVSLGDETTTLTQLADGAYVMTTLDGENFYFQNSDHRQITAYNYLDRDALSYVYDANGILQSISNDFGGQLNFFYDADGLLNNVVDLESRRQIDLRYDDAGNLVELVDVAGGITRFAYDNGLMVSLTNPRGEIATITYQDMSVTTVATDLTNLGFDYDPIAKRTIVSEQVGDETLTTTYAFTQDNQLDTVQAPNQCTVDYDFDENGNVTRFVDGNNNETTWFYTEEGLFQAARGPIRSTITVYELIDETITAGKRDIVEHIVIPAENFDEFVVTGNVDTIDVDRVYAVAYTYDSISDAPTSITLPTGLVQRYTYNAAGYVTSATDEDGNTTTFEYNERGDLIAFTNAEGNRFLLGYDAAGNVITETDPLGNVIAREYNDAGQETRVTYPNGATESYDYDANGNLLRVTDVSGFVTSYTYDALDRMTSVTNPLGATTTYTYDERGLLTERVDANGNVTRFVYDAVGNLIAEEHSTGEITQFEYGCGSASMAQIMPDGGRTQYTRNTDGAITDIVYPDGSTVNNQYDYMGELIQMSDSSGMMAIELDDYLRPINVTDSNGNTLGYDYSTSAFSPSAYVYPDGSRYDYTYNGVGLPTSVTDEEGTTSYTYRFDGKPLTRTLPNGIVTSYTYDENGFNTQITHTRGDETLIQYDYTFGISGFIEQEIVSGTDILNETINYTYDAAGQLLTSVSDTGNFERFAYDAAGNRTRLETPDGLTSYIYNQRNQLVQQTNPDGLATLFNYDANGNLSDEISTAGMVMYGYDTNNRLVTITTPDDATEYLYNGLDDRVAMIVNGERTNFIQDFNRPNTITLATQTDAGFTNYTYAVGYVAERDATGETGYYLTDFLYSVIGYTDEAGQVLESYDYSSYGMPLFDGEMQADFSYANEWFDQTNGLLYLRARHYSPEQGRFISEDIYHGTTTDWLSQNQYHYAFNNPITYTDPSGLCPAGLFKTFLVLAAGFFGAAGALGLVAAGSPFLVAAGVFVFMSSLFGVATGIANIMDGGTRPGGLIEAGVVISGGDATDRSIAAAADFAVGLIAGGHGKAYAYDDIAAGVLGNATNIAGAIGVGQGIGNAVSGEIAAGLNVGLSNNNSGTSGFPSGGAGGGFSGNAGGSSNPTGGGSGGSGGSGGGSGGGGSSSNGSSSGSSSTGDSSGSGSTSGSSSTGGSTSGSGSTGGGTGSGSTSGSGSTGGGTGSGSTSGSGSTGGSTGNTSNTSGS
ncbi:MAG: RHS repeat-associated core domain-containing protein, partial [Phototrophicaceae bacterium]